MSDDGREGTEWHFHASRLMNNQIYRLQSEIRTKGGPPGPPLSILVDQDLLSKIEDDDIVEEKPVTQSTDILSFL